MAKETFNQYFDYLIRDLLSLFPADHKDKEGQPFWSGPKRCPSPISFNEKDDRHLNFILSYANLIAVALSIPENRDVEKVRAIAKKVKVKAYEPKKIEVKLEENKEGAEQPPEQNQRPSEDDEAKI